jgi:S1-C subfamily serine protease
MKVLLRALLGALVILQSVPLVYAPGAAWAGPAAPSVERAKRSLGVMVAPVPPGAKGILMLDRDRGMIIVDVASGGLADKSGLRKGDVLLAISGRPINRENDLSAAMSAAAETGQAIAEISRQGKILDVAIAF